MDAVWHLPVNCYDWLSSSCLVVSGCLAVLFLSCCLVVCAAIEKVSAMTEHVACSGIDQMVFGVQVTKGTLEQVSHGCQERFPMIELMERRTILGDRTEYDSQIRYSDSGRQYYATC